MKVRLTVRQHLGVFLLAFLALAGQAAATFQTVSVRDASVTAPVSAGGDSSSSVISEDGRFVLFASSAENLVANYVSPASGLVLKPLNVFLRDRTAGTTTLVSVQSNGVTGGNDYSAPLAISTNGQFALFESNASDLVPGDTNNLRDIFLRDVLAGVTMLITIGTNGDSGNGLPESACMTPDGRFVAFASAASNLVSGDVNGIIDVFVRDRQTATTKLVSVGATLAGSSYLSHSETPEITPDGRYVAFHSSATNLIAGLTFTNEIYVRDLIDGTTTWVTTNARSVALSVLGSSRVSCYNHSISADGHYVAFEVEVSTNYSWVPATGLILRHDLQTGITDMAATNACVSMTTPLEQIHTLDMTPDGRSVAFVTTITNISGSPTCIQLWDSQSGTNLLISGGLDGSIVAGTVCDWPRVDASGRYVAFVSNATNLTANALTGEFHCFLRDTFTGTTTVVDVNTNGIGSGMRLEEGPAAMSADGRYIAFTSADNSIVANDRNRAPDVFLRDTTSGISELISAAQPALPALSANGNSGLPSYTVSTNGRYVAFESDADNLVPGDTNGYRDVFVRDLQTGINQLVSVGTNGTSANGPSFTPFISTDGRFVAFGSTARNLAPLDTNSVQDIYVRDMLQNTTALVSLSVNKLSAGNRDSSAPTISADGRYISYFSQATNLVTNVLSSTSLFVRDCLAGTNYLLVANATARSVTPDGSKIAYTGSTSPTVLQVWNTSALTKTTIYSSNVALTQLAISPNGQRVAYKVGASVIITSIQGGTNWTAISNAVSSLGTGNYLPAFSADGRFFVFANRATNSLDDLNTFSDIYLYDTQAGTNLLVSRAFNSGFAANGNADSPRISTDGRFVAYRSFATNEAQADFNAASDIFLFDRFTSATTLISPSKTGDTTANHFSSAPLFSGSGQVLFFQSWASDLKNGDYNQTSDLFALSLDTDNDGMDDQWETDNFGTLARDGTGDFDNDGATDLLEFQTGTNPTDSSSIFIAQITAGIGENPHLSWPMKPSHTARVQFKNDLSDAVWQDLAGTVSIFGTNGTATDLSPAADKRFYRIILSE